MGFFWQQSAWQHWTWLRFYPKNHKWERLCLLFRSLFCLTASYCKWAAAGESYFFLWCISREEYTTLIQQNCAEHNVIMEFCKSRVRLRLLLLFTFCAWSSLPLLPSFCPHLRLYFSWDVFNLHGKGGNENDIRAVNVGWIVKARSKYSSAWYVYGRECYL